ncbi:hypothetical protein [Pseudarthrobacter sp. H2]|uniref:hypothetical protein n=1 Tax=Pseudarthrobacter sp. H2 TaxID=3418415 RepID=UPI003CF8521A
MSNISPDEQPKKTMAKRVITPKRKYFLPFEGKTLDAEDLADVEKQLIKEKELEVGDVNN